MKADMKFLDRLRRPPLLTVPGVYDALGAHLVARAGFEGAFVSGAGVAYSKLGRPDIGLVSVSELADTVGHIRERVDLPLIVDMDTGFGNAVNAARSVRLLAQRGATAVQIEDQTFPKRCGHLRGKSIVPTAEMVGKLKAVLDHRPSADVLVVARTDAIAVEGFEAALDRAEAYAEAGADVLFVEAPRSRAEFAEIGRRFGRRIPLLANMVEGGDSPVTYAGDLGSLGFAIALFPGALARAAVKSMEALLGVLRANGTTAPFAPQMHTLKSLNDVLGTDQLLADSARYDPGIRPGFDKVTE
jgi:2-methylisocitrate lyase-like PEP mutase family enzyme